jgi:hypothetical protein
MQSWHLCQHCDGVIASNHAGFVAGVAPASSPLLRWHVCLCCAGIDTLDAPTLLPALRWRLCPSCNGVCPVVTPLATRRQMWHRCLACCRHVQPCRHAPCCCCCTRRRCCCLRQPAKVYQPPCRFGRPYWAGQCLTVRCHTHSVGVRPSTVIAVRGIVAVSGIVGASAIQAPAFASPAALAGTLAPLS